MNREERRRIQKILDFNNPEQLRKWLGSLSRDGEFMNHLVTPKGKRVELKDASLKLLQRAAQVVLAPQVPYQPIR